MDNRGSRIVERGVKYIYDEKKEERERKDRSVDRSAFFLADGNEIENERKKVVRLGNNFRIREMSM